MNYRISSSTRPGFAPERLASLMRSAVERLELDLRGATVLTEAATGAYGVTAPMAVLAGADRVIAQSRDTQHGTAAEAFAWTGQLADLVADKTRIEVVDRSLCSTDILTGVDIVTNSGHVRPINEAVLSSLRPGGVVALMYESWELRGADIDVEACRRRGIRIAGVNERHPGVDVFSYLGPLCVGQMQLAGYPVYGCLVAVVCDNDFGAFLMGSLNGMGAHAHLFQTTEALTAGPWDVVVIALKPADEPRVGVGEVAHLHDKARGALIAQFWGDINRAAAVQAGLRVMPEIAPAPGHMAVFLSDIGPDAVVRLQSGGLKAAEHVWRDLPMAEGCIADLV